MIVPAAIATALVTALIWAPVAAADTFVVTERDDPRPTRCDKDCSVREAVIAANEHAGADVVSMPTIGPHNRAGHRAARMQDATATSTSPLGR